MMKILRGDIFVANLDPAVGHEMKKIRPVIIVSNNTGNEFSGTVTIVPITSQKLEKIYPFEVLLPESTSGLTQASKAKTDQIRTLDKSRLIKRLGRLDSDTVLRLNRAVKIHLDL